MLKLKKIIEMMLNQEISEEQGPCWDGYQQIGMKDQDGKQVPNCVPIKEVEKSKEKDESDDKPKKRRPQRLSPEQAAEIDLDDDGKITSKDFKLLRKLKK